VAADPGRGANHHSLGALTFHRAQTESALGTGGTECTSQRAGKNPRCQRVCLSTEVAFAVSLATSVFTHAL
jgi:hypothetical protein